MTATWAALATIESLLAAERAKRLAAGLPELRAIDVSRQLMQEVGSVVVGFFPDSMLIPTEGAILDRWGHDRLPKGTRLVVGERVNVNAWISQAARVWGADFARQYPRVKGAKFFRCTLVEKTIRKECL